MSLEADHILATAPSIPRSPEQTNSFVHVMSMATFDDIFDCCVFQVHFCQPVETTKEARLNAMPATNKLPEMEISRCLCSQIGEHDEMKKNSL